MAFSASTGPKGRCASWAPPGLDTTALRLDSTGPERLAAEYLFDLNATQAAVRAGYSARSSVLVHR